MLVLNRHVSQVRCIEVKSQHPPSPSSKNTCRAAAQSGQLVILRWLILLVLGLNICHSVSGMDGCAQAHLVDIAMLINGVQHNGGFVIDVFLLCVVHAKAQVIVANC